MRSSSGLLLLLVSSAISSAETPLALHPDNPHYFLFRGKPTILITSGEHYGAVLNRDFDYLKYLETLHKDGLNLTRLFSGIYCEPEKAFNIANNTLAPLSEKFICPWVRSATPGYKNGGNKFDLDKWDDAYFARLKDFMTQASSRGVVVEMVLFCPFYEDSMWDLSPLNPANNVNNSPVVKRTDVWALKNEFYTALQDKFTRKFVEELNGFDNFYFEICNEPYFGGVTLEFQKHIADTIVAAEKNLPNKHLIAQNIANGKAKINKPNPAVSIFNFHYATPPDTVHMNYALNRPLGDDETGFKGIKDETYRQEAWHFILAGGAIFDNLDYSFTAGHEAGDFVLPPKQPGGGGVKFRAQMKVLKDFIHGFDFVKMKPDAGALTSLAILKDMKPEKTEVRVLAEIGRQYAIYIRGGSQAEATFTVPPGDYEATWIDTHSGTVLKTEVNQHPGGAPIVFTGPNYVEDVALKVVRKF